jgi:hypothetical protein
VKQRAPRRRELRRTQRALQKAAHAILYPLRPGESIVTTYDAKAAPCDCPAMTTWMGFLPCVTVARHDDYDRCVRCGVMWTKRACTWMPATILREAA